VKVTGQIVYVREPEYFMMQNGHGLRLVAKQPAGVQAGEMVTALDEIVWAMNPRHNSLASLISYCLLAILNDNMYCAVHVANCAANYL
jgi:hypothetical protein